MSDTKANLLMQELGSIMGIDGLDFTEQGECILQFDDNVVHFHHNGKNVIKMMAVITENEEVPPLLMNSMLQMNYRTLGDTVLALDPIGYPALITGFAIDYLDIVGFQDYINGFLTQLQQWQEKIADNQFGQENIPASQQKDVGGILV